MTGWRVRDRVLAVDGPLIMGVLNVTPDSFSDGGTYLDRAAAIERGRRLVADGAGVVDVGGESTRPGAEPVPAEVEIDRVVPVVEALSAEGIVVSVDTMKPEVAAAAVSAGASIINDVTGMTDPDMRRVAAVTGVGVVVMHMQGSPRTMQLDPTYDDVVSDVGRYLEEQATRCVADGIAQDVICIDPGIGFGKTVRHNLELIDGLGSLVELGYPVMLGASRKSFLGRLLDLAEPEQRDLATAITTALAVERGARVVRVHDPASSREAARLVRAILESRSPRRLTGLT